MTLVALILTLSFAQNVAYLDAVFQYWTEKGIILTQPEERV